MTALALTDRDGLYGAVKFALACRSAGVRPIFGVDLPIAPALDTALPPALATALGGAACRPAVRRPPAPAPGACPGWGQRRPAAAAGHLPRPGRRRLAVAVPAHQRHPSAQHPGGAGELAGDGRRARQRADRAARARLLGGPGAAHRPARPRRRPSRRLAGGVRSRPAGARGGPPPGPGRPLRAPRRCSGSPPSRACRWCSSNAVRYVDALDAPTADVLDAARRLVPLDARHVDRRTAEGYLKSGKEMAEVAEDLVGPDRDAGACGCSSAPPGWPSSARSTSGRTSASAASAIPSWTSSPRRPSGGWARREVLRARCEAGLGRRGMAPSERVRQRLDEELAVIDQLGYPSYFLTVADVVDLIKSLRVRAAARGSGAGSLVTYLLGISDVDPLRYGLLMERFLSPLRHQLPDIDIDVESARRMEVYDAVIDRFGADRVSCISMMDTYRVRHAIRDVGAALGLPPAEIDAVAKAFPHIRANQVHAALKDLPELRASRLGSKRGGGTGDLDLLFDLVSRLDGLPRHIALHPCGVLLSDATLLDRTPVENSYLGYPMSQFDKDDVEELGLLKLDLLGIRMQSAIAHAIDEVARVDGETVDIDAVPRDDPATFELIRSTRTLGMFQIESPGQRELVGKFGPQTFEDIIIDISLFRPGPVKSDMVTPFLMARNGWRDAVYPHPDLEFALAETAGVVVFHEQVLQVVARMTGCTLAEADEVRRALGEKDAHPEVRAWFVPQALAAGYPVEVAEQVWTVLAAFGSFGFCKAHAAAFALPTYQSAWLKTHHPAAFLAGVLTHDPGMYPKRLILDDARNFGIRVLGLDVNASAGTYRRRADRADAEDMAGRGRAVRPAGSGRSGCRPRCGTPSDYGIRLALADVKGISDDEVARIVTGQPYRSLTDFWHRASVSRPVVERLVLAGGFDSLYGFGVRDREAGRPTHRRKQVTRRDLLLQIGELDRWSRSGARASSSGQLSLDLMGLELPEDEPVEEGPEETGPELGGGQRAAGVHRRRAGARRAGGARAGRQPARRRLLQAVPRRARGGSGRRAAHLPQRRGGAGRRGQGGDPDPADPLGTAGGLRDPRRRHRLHRLDLLRGRPGPLRRHGVPLLAAGHPRGAAAHRPARGVAAGHRGLGAAGAARGVGGRRARRGARPDGGAGGVHRARRSPERRRRGARGR